MNQKLKISLSILGVFIILIIGLASYNLKNNISSNTAEKQTTKNTKETQLVTTSALTGNTKTDAEINTVINEILSENDLNSELEDVDLTLAQEEEINQINNLFNENEL